METIKLHKYPDKVEVRVYTGLGLYAGMFLWPTKAIDMLKTMNKMYSGYTFDIRTTKTRRPKKTK